MTDAQALPPAHNDEVVEVSLKHVIWGFGGLIVGSIVVGTSVTLVRDYVKLKRQKALIEAAFTTAFYIQRRRNLMQRREDGIFIPNEQIERAKKIAGWIGIAMLVFEGIRIVVKRQSKA